MRSRVVLKILRVLLLILLAGEQDQALGRGSDGSADPGSLVGDDQGRMIGAERRAGGIEAAFKRELEAHPEPAKRLEEIRAWAEALRSPFRTAESFYAEEIIDPRETRPLLCEWAGLAQRMLETGPSSFGMRP